MIQFFDQGGKVKKEAVTLASVGAIIFIIATISKIYVDQLMIKKLRLDIGELEARKPAVEAVKGG